MKNVYIGLLAIVGGLLSIVTSKQSAKQYVEYHSRGSAKPIMPVKAATLMFVIAGMLMIALGCGILYKYSAWF